MKKLGRSLLQSHRSSICRLAALEALRALSIVAAACAMAWLAQEMLLGGKTPSEAAPMLLALLFSMLCRSLLELLAANRRSRLSLAFQQENRKQLHQAIFSSPAMGEDSGRLLTLSLETVESFDQLFRQTLGELVSCTVLLPLLLLLMFGLAPITAAIFLVTLPIAPLLLYLIGRATQERNAAAWEELARLNTTFHELLRGIPVLKLFGQAEAALLRLRKISETSSRTTLRALQLAFVSSFALELVTTLSIALIAVNVGLRLLYGSLDFFTAFLALLLAPEFYRPIRQGGASFHAAMKAKEAASALEDFRKRRNFCRGTAGRIERTPMPPEIRLEDLCFRYPGKESPALRDINLSFPAGSPAVLAGTSGSGKSTLLRLLAGLAEPQQGRILLNGLPMARMERESLFRCLAYVPQMPHVFQATLRDNLTLFQNKDDALIIDAMERCGLLDFARTLPQWLDTPMGGMNRALSHGQTHRLGLARAVLQDAPLLLLDEITAGLDEEGERQLLPMLEDLCYRRTVILASHRPAILKWAPRIVLLDASRVIAEGTFDELSSQIEKEK